MKQALFIVMCAVMASISLACGDQCSSDDDCLQSTEQCFGHKLGTRDRLGECDDGYCDYDAFSNKVCSIEQCNAACEETADCDDTDRCVGNKTKTRDAVRCDTSCHCDYGSWSPAQCVKDSCNAQCANDADCDDQNEHTTDTCQGNCACKHVAEPYCGDNILQAGEQCELPSSSDNQDCQQSETSCEGTKTISRDSYGSCSASCGCVEDSFGAAACVKDSCGATCATDADCDDQNSATVDRCEESCSCSHEQQVPEFGTIASLVALAGAVAGFFVVRKK